MYAFEYHRPTTLADATALLKAAADGNIHPGDTPIRRISGAKD